MKNLLFAVLLCAAGLAHADDALFMPGVVSNDGGFALTLSPDGTHALWVKSGSGRGKLVIMEMRKEQGQWQAPTIAPFSGIPGWNDIDPMFSPDGKTLVFQSNRPVADRPGRKGFDIYAVDLGPDGWGPLRHLGHDINTDESESSAAIAANGNIYFARNDGVAQSDIWVSTPRDGQYGVARKLPAPVNTNARESNPYIAPDESYLVYFSAVTMDDRPDLYISFRQGEGWSAPRRLAAPINSPDPQYSEFTPFVHGGRIYLTRMRRDGERYVENVVSYPFDPGAYR